MVVMADYDLQKGPHNMYSQSLIAKQGQQKSYFRDVSSTLSVSFESFRVLPFGSTIK